MLGFRDLLSEKNNNRQIELDEKKLGERIFAGLKRIATDTVPFILVENQQSMAHIIRRIDANTFIRMPEKPSIDLDEIDMDEMLLDALAFYVMAGIEKVKAKVHMGMYHGEIDMNNARLIETVLSCSEDDGELDRYNQFP